MSKVEINSKMGQQDKSLLPFDLLQLKIRELMEKETRDREQNGADVSDDNEEENKNIHREEGDDHDDEGQVDEEEEDEELDGEKEGEEDNDNEKDNSREEEIGMFGVELEKLMDLQGEDNGDIPMILTVIMEKIKSMRGLKTEGIFRVNGNMRDVETLATEGFDPTDEEKVYSVFTWASLLKKWIRELPSSLVPIDLYDEFVACTSEEEVNERVLLHIDNKLQREVLRAIGLFFGQLLSDRNTVHTKMSVESVSTILTPSLFPTKVTVSVDNITLLVQRQKKELEAVKHMLMYYKQLYYQQQRQLQQDIQQEKEKEKLLKQQKNRSLKRQKKRR